MSDRNFKLCLSLRGVSVAAPLVGRANDVAIWCNEGIASAFWPRNDGRDMNYYV